MISRWTRRHKKRRDLCRKSSLKTSSAPISRRLPAASRPLSAPPKGQSSYFNIIPKFRCEDLHPTALGTGIHPAFIVGGVEKSEIMIATYQAVIRDGEAVSQPGQVPTTRIDFDAARATCLAAGPGFHLMTNWEWAAIALWCIANGIEVRGNTSWGKSHSHPDETGTCGDNGGNITLTGSGPDTWRHDGTPFGIADLVGNVWEWVDGLKLLSGKIVMPSDNDITLPESEWPDIGAFFDLPNGHPTISNEITSTSWDGKLFASIGLKDGFESPLAVRQAMLLPHSVDMVVDGYLWADNHGGFEALPFRGGYWYNESAAGLAALRLYCGRSGAVSFVGFRPAFVL